MGIFDSFKKKKPKESSGDMKPQTPLKQQQAAPGPSDALAHYNLGNAYSAQGKLDEAVREYQEALRINPNLAEAHNNLGLAYSDQGKLDEAVRECQEALKINPNLAAAHLNLGLAYSRQGKLNEAIECYQGFSRLAPPQHAPKSGRQKKLSVS
jgi:superkiller protein 3